MDSDSCRSETLNAPRPFCLRRSARPALEKLRCLGDECFSVVDPGPSRISVGNYAHHKANARDKKDNPSLVSSFESSSQNGVPSKGRDPTAPPGWSNLLRIPSRQAQVPFLLETRSLLRQKSLAADRTSAGRSLPHNNMGLPEERMLLAQWRLLPQVVLDSRVRPDSIAGGDRRRQGTATTRAMAIQPFPSSLRPTHCGPSSGSLMSYMPTAPTDHRYPAVAETRSCCSTNCNGQCTRKRYIPNPEDRCYWEGNSSHSRTNELQPLVSALAPSQTP